MAALRAGFAEFARFARLCPRADLQAGWHAGRIGDARRSGAPKAHSWLKIMKPLLVILMLLGCSASAALAASDNQPPPAGTFAGAPPEFTRFSVGELQRGF